MKQKKKTVAFMLLGIAGFILFNFPSFTAAEEPPTELECKGGTVQVKNPVTGVSSCECPPGQDLDEAGRCQLTNPASGQLVDIDNFPDLARLIITTLLSIAGAIAVIFLLIGGFQYVTSRGNEEAMESAKKTIFGAIIGVVVIAMSYTIVVIINNILTTKP